MSQGPFLRKYGVQTTVNFQLFEVDGVNFRINAVHAAGDTTIMKNEGAEASTSNAFVDEGQGYSIVLTATEMQAARIVIYAVDLTATKVWLDTAIVIETYGNASAAHAMDFDDAVRGGMTALPNAAADAAGGLAISDAGGLDLDAILVDTGTTLQAELDAIQAAVITNAAGVDIAADIIAIKSETAAIVNDTDLIDDATSGLAKIATDVAATLVDTGTTLDGKLDAIAGYIDTEVASLVTAVITNAAGADISADIAAAKADTAAILIDTADMQPKLGTPAGTDVSADIAAVKSDTAATLVDTAEIGTAGAGLSDLGGMSTGMQAEVNTEVADVLKTDTISELSQATPAATPTFETALMLLYMALRNKLTVTITEQGIHNNAGTKIIKSTLSDDDTTFTNDKMAAGP